jgi:phosphohistidine phosphatase
VKNVHDLRTSIRHLMTSIELIERFKVDATLERARLKLKKQLSELSDLRDTHVEIVAVRGFLKEMPELQEFHDELRRQENSYLKRAKKTAPKSDLKFIENAINRTKIRLSGPQASLSMPGSRKIIDSAVDSLFDNVTKKLQVVNVYNYSTIHEVRLAFKPFRYAIMILQPVIPTDSRQLRSAQSLSRIMGRIQDLEILMKHLAEFRWSSEKSRGAMIEVWLELERAKTEAAQRFLRSIPKFGKIWKPIIQEPTRVKAAPTQTMYILRHGIAESRGAANYRLDSDRALTSKGIKRMRQVAKGLNNLGVKFDTMLSSPYRRALETAFIVSRQFGAGESIQSSPSLKPEVLPEQVVRTLQEKYASCRNLMLVGHEPQLSSLVSYLTTGSASARPILKKGGVCKLQVEKLEAGKCATLVWLLTPKQLANIT